MKIAATAVSVIQKHKYEIGFVSVTDESNVPSYKAVPSIFIAEPMGSINFAMFSLTLLFSIMHLSVIGIVAELQNRNIYGKLTSTIKFTLTSMKCQKQLSMLASIHE